MPLPSTSRFSQITRVGKYTAFGKESHDHDAGETMAVKFRLVGQDFIAINGGPIFCPNPSISVFVRCKTADAVRSLWDAAHGPER
jgi:predicted 3-demethylubiquinone-9 3-methyltransferase (glyoxalase superfamily)